MQVIPIPDQSTPFLDVHWSMPALPLPRRLDIIFDLELELNPSFPPALTTGLW